MNCPNPFSVQNHESYCRQEGLRSTDRKHTFVSEHVRCHVKVTLPIGVNTGSATSTSPCVMVTCEGSMSGHGSAIFRISTRVRVFFGLPLMMVGRFMVKFHLSRLTFITVTDRCLLYQNRQKAKTIKVHKK